MGKGLSGELSCPVTGLVYKTEDANQMPYVKGFEGTVWMHMLTIFCCKLSKVIFL